jgi:hypothetical protein
MHSPLFSFKEVAWHGSCHVSRADRREEQIDVTEELRAAFVNGLAIALITAGAVMVWSRSTGLTLVIGVSMVL